MFHHSVTSKLFSKKKPGAHIKTRKPSVIIPSIICLFCFCSCSFVPPPSPIKGLAGCCTNSTVLLKMLTPEPSEPRLIKRSETKNIGALNCFFQREDDVMKQIFERYSHCLSYIALLIMFIDHFCRNFGAFYRPVRLVWNCTNSNISKDQRKSTNVKTSSYIFLLETADCSRHKVAPVLSSDPNCAAFR